MGGTVRFDRGIPEELSRCQQVLNVTWGWLPRPAVSENIVRDGWRRAPY